MTDTNQTNPTISQEVNEDSGIRRYKGCCCRGIMVDIYVSDNIHTKNWFVYCFEIHFLLTTGAYEYPWLKEESCCFCCGIRCALLSLNIFSIIDGFITLGMGLFFALGEHKSAAGAIIDSSFGISMIIFGCIGYYGTLKTNELYLRIFWYWSLAIIPLIIGICSFGIIEFIISDSPTMIIIMVVDMISSVIIWSYIAYKVKRFYDLVFSHYQQLSGGDGDEENKQSNTNDTDHIVTV